MTARIHHIMAVLLAVLSISCRDEKKENAPDTTPPSVNAEPLDAPAEKPVKEYCFIKVNGKDTIRLTYVKNGDSINGTYDNLHYGIDKRRSTFTGVLKNDHAVVLSQYSSEGNDYSEELHFEIEKDLARLNYGEAVQGKDGIWRPKPGAAVQQHMLPKGDCQ